MCPHTAGAQAIKWTYSSDVALSPDRKSKATILQRFHFSSQLKRMSAIVRVEAQAAGLTEHMAVLKGAPEVIRGLLGTLAQL